MGADVEGGEELIKEIGQGWRAGRGVRLGCDVRLGRGPSILCPGCPSPAHLSVPHSVTTLSAGWARSGPPWVEFPCCT